MHRASRLLSASLWMAPSSLLWPAAAFAQEAAPDVAASTGPLGALTMLVPYGAMFFVVWLLILRPAANQRREQQTVLAGLKRDDEVVTQSGLIGRIAAIEENVVVLELADRVKVRMLRDRIVGPYHKPAAKGA